MPCIIMKIVRFFIKNEQPPTILILEKKYCCLCIVMDKKVIFQILKRIENGFSNSETHRKKKVFKQLQNA